MISYFVIKFLAFALRAAVVTKPLIMLMTLVTQLRLKSFQKD